jgi:hypothetical protein
LFKKRQPDPSEFNRDTLQSWVNQMPPGGSESTVNDAVNNMRDHNIFIGGAEKLGDVFFERSHGYSRHIGEAALKPLVSET